MPPFAENNVYIITLARHNYSDSAVGTRKIYNRQAKGSAFSLPFISKKHRLHIATGRRKTLQFFDLPSAIVNPCFTPQALAPNRSPTQAWLPKQPLGTYIAFNIRLYKDVKAIMSHI